MPTRSAPRVLTLTLEFIVPEGLAGDVRFAHVERAVENVSTTIQALAPTIFPRADQLVVTGDWSYRWMRNTTAIKLPATEQNTR